MFGLFRITSDGFQQRKEAVMPLLDRIGNYLDTTSIDMILVDAEKTLKDTSKMLVGVAEFTVKEAYDKIEPIIRPIFDQAKVYQKEASKVIQVITYAILGLMVLASFFGNQWLMGGVAVTALFGEFFGLFLIKRKYGDKLAILAALITSNSGKLERIGISVKNVEMAIYEPIIEVLFLIPFSALYYIIRPSIQFLAILLMGYYFINLLFAKYIKWVLGQRMNTWDLICWIATIIWCILMVGWRGIIPEPSSLTVDAEIKGLHSFANVVCELAGQDNFIAQEYLDTLAVVDSSKKIVDKKQGEKIGVWAWLFGAKTSVDAIHKTIVGALEKRLKNEAVNQEEQAVINLMPYHMVWFNYLAYREYLPAGFLLLGFAGIWVFHFSCLLLASRYKEKQLLWVVIFFVGLVALLVCYMIFFRNAGLGAKKISGGETECSMVILPNDHALHRVSIQGRKTREMAMICNDMSDGVVYWGREQFAPSTKVASSGQCVKGLVEVDEVALNIHAEAISGKEVFFRLYYPVYPDTNVKRVKCK